jgi:hypothetical protein
LQMNLQMKILPQPERRMLNARRFT